MQNVHFTALDTDQPFKTIFGNGQINHNIDQVEKSLYSQMLLQFAPTIEFHIPVLLSDALGI